MFLSCNATQHWTGESMAMAASANEIPTASNTGKTPPGHDIFCTPENSHFHSKTPYRALDASKREIRLIAVLPDDGCGLIKCELLHNMPLAEVQSRYFALSYCAGDAHKTDIVLVDGVRCNVFANLRHALGAARHFFKTNPEKLESRDGRFLMWVDQICINQYDLNERSQQVGFMRDIYQCAQETLICLSTSESEASGMKWLLELCDKVPPQERDMTRSYQPGLMYKGDTLKRRYHWFRLEEYLWKNFRNERFIDGWDSFYDMIESPWWSRAWVFQEFIASSAVSLLCWTSSASWSDVSPILRSFCLIHRDMIKDAKEALDFYGSKPVGPTDHPFCHVINRIARTNSQLAVDTVYSMVNRKTRGIDSFIDLKELLAHSRYCKASDDRDRVFAFLGLAHPGYGIIPNYSTDNDISNVLIETTKSIILFEGRLDVLSHAAIANWSTRRMLPSWVADWTCEVVSGLRKSSRHPPYWENIGDGSSANANASFHTIKSPQGHYQTVALEVSGVFVDTLHFYIGSQQLLDHKEEQWWKFRTQKYMYKLFTTNQAKSFDQLWILDGAPEPLILRPKDSGYRLISIAGLALPETDGRMMSIEELLRFSDVKSKRILII